MGVWIGLAPPLFATAYSPMTPAIDLLKKHHATFDVHSYAHDPKAASVVWRPPKNFVWRRSVL